MRVLWLLVLMSLRGAAAWRSVHRGLLGNIGGASPICGNSKRSAATDATTTQLFSLSTTMDATTDAAASTAESASNNARDIWMNSWYPVAVIDELDPTQPNAVTLLGRDLVLWRCKTSDASPQQQQQQRWCVAEDMCPHRLAPLSEGFLDEKTQQLTCRYHGWQFDGCGKCSCIPQAENREALSNNRNRLQLYPSQEAQGLLWVWPHTKTNAAEVTMLQQQHPLPLFNDFDGCAYQTRFLPMDYEAMMENTFDPSHAMFLHDSPGSSFNSEEAVPMSKFSRSGAIRSSGFDLLHNGYSKKNRDMDALRRFVAPYTNYVRYVMPPSGLEVNTVLYFLPVRPGFTRVIGGFTFKRPTTSDDAAAATTTTTTDATATDEATASSSSKGKNRDEANPNPSILSSTITQGVAPALTQQQQRGKWKLDGDKLKMDFLFGMLGLVTALKKLLLPHWLRTSLDHLRGAGIEEQDIFMMHFQKLNLQKREQQRRNWKNSYFLPTKADIGVLTFRQWFQKHSAGRVHWLDPPTPLTASTAANGVSSGGKEAVHLAERLDEKQLLDRWSRHTKHCAHCRKSLALCTRLSAVLPPLRTMAAAFTALATVAAESRLLPAVSGRQLLLLRLSAVAAALLTATISLLLSTVANLQRQLLRGQHPFGKMVH